MTGPGLDVPRLIAAKGPLRVEAALLDDLFAALPGTLDEIARSPGPVRVVVPSRSLRRHLLARVASRRQGVLGLEVATLRRTAAQVLEGAGRMEPRGDSVVEILLRRAAAVQPALARALGDLDDGIAAAVASLRDLLEAGFEPEIAPALEEALAEVSRDPTLERARALVRAATVASREARRLRVGTVSDLYRAAREVVLARGPAALPSRLLLVHGFADATALATDFLETLTARAGARVYLDLETGSEEGDAPSATSFGWRLRDRLRGVAAPESRSPDDRTLPASSFSSTDLRAEVREAGFRILELLEKGVPPERIGLVARDLAPYAVTLRGEWKQLGIPFSGEGTVDTASAASRRIAATLDLVERGEKVGIERWLSLRGDGGIVPFDLRLALHQLGASRLERAAALDPSTDLPSGDFPLPIREGLDPVGADEGSRSRRRRLPRGRLVAALAEARALTARLAEWPERGTMDRHLRALARIRDLFPREAGSPGEEDLDGALARLAGDTPRQLELDRDELARLLRGAVSPAQGEPLGGRGAGVQVLDVTEARGRTFDALFLLGLHGGGFPRTVSEDPLLPDRVRTALATVLPDLPRKLEGHDEERMLFAQLLSAAPLVVVSRSALDAEGRPLTPSPLLARFRERIGPESEILAGATSPDGGWQGAGSRRLAPADAAIQGALLLPRSQFLPFLAAALGELEAEGSGVPDALRAGALLAALEELDPDLSTAAGRTRRSRLGPFFGFVGPATEPEDPRRRALFVTRLEALCTCPWKQFLERMLKLAPPADGAAELPPLEPSRLGRIVHAVLQRLGIEAGASDGAPLATTLSGHSARLLWPAPDRLGSLARTEASRLLAEEGLASWRLTAAEVARALPYLEVARGLDAPGADLLGVEIEGRIDLPGDPAGPALRFRADRVELRGGRPLLTDFKTGSLRERNTSAKGRRTGLVAGIARGEQLQAVAYAASLGSAEGAGRYLYLDPVIEGDRREILVESGDAEALAALEAALATGSAALTCGALFPRLLDDSLEKASDTCSRCDVAVACLQHDSGARLRLAGRIEALRQEGGPPPSDAEAALGALHDLGRGAGAKRS